MSRMLAIFDGGDAAASTGPAAHRVWAGGFVRRRDLARSVHRLSARVLAAWERSGSGRLEGLRTWTGQQLVQGTILACATLKVARRTPAGSHAARQWRRLVTLARRAWAEAEGFEAEAIAGVALVVLAFAIVVHGLAS